VRDAINAMGGEAPLRAIHSVHMAIMASANPPIQLRIVDGVDDTHSTGAEPIKHDIAARTGQVLVLASSSAWYFAVDCSTALRLLCASTGRTARARALASAVGWY
jgi:hypothetical protein